MTDKIQDVPSSYTPSTSTEVDKKFSSTMIDDSPALSIFEMFFGLSIDATIPEVNPTRTTNKDSADECEHCWQLDEPEEFESILGLRRLVLIHQYECSFGYTLNNCPMSARACKSKIEYDNNNTDISSIAFIELGIRDIDVIYDDSDDDWINDDDFDVAEESP